MSTFNRSSGILLHPSALSGQYGIGTLGKETLSFLDWLKDAGQSYWQICPLVPTGYGDSPYQGFSAFAGNPNLIDLDHLVSLNLLEKDTLKPFMELSQERVDFGKLIPLKKTVLGKAWQRFPKGNRQLKREFQQFQKSSRHWLEDFCLFTALKDFHDGKPWYLWPSPVKLREPEAIKTARKNLAKEMQYHAFIQFIFDKQWKIIRKEATARGVKIIGDLPIFVAFDSSDCWSNPEIFQLTNEGLPSHVAGVPPDYFTETGQLWGNPLYRWDVMEQNNFRWWLSILKNKMEQYDVLRIDHFRGFAAYWSVPYGDATAENGQWMPASGEKLFQVLRDSMGNLPIIAEDLGVITPDVVDLMRKFDFPGMKVLQFSFDSSEEDYCSPVDYHHHCIVYTGTHDNDTTTGWFESLGEEEKRVVCRRLKLSEDCGTWNVTRAMVELALKSAADVAIIPIQDILGLGSHARFNTPGSAGGNWSWRMASGALHSEQAGELRELTGQCKRLAQ